jgi:HrpA-like RNA helicase
LAEDRKINQGKTIVCTQPRGIAASALAERVAEEWMTKLGGQVGLSLIGEKV